MELPAHSTILGLSSSVVRDMLLEALEPGQKAKISLNQLSSRPTVWDVACCLWFPYRPQSITVENLMRADASVTGGILQLRSVLPVAHYLQFDQLLERIVDHVKQTATSHQYANRWLETAVALDLLDLQAALVVNWGKNLLAIKNANIDASSHLIQNFLGSSGLSNAVVAAAIRFVANEGLDSTDDVMAWLQSKPVDYADTTMFSWKIKVDPAVLRSNPHVLDQMVSPEFPALGMRWTLVLEISEQEGGGHMLGCYLKLQEPRPKLPLRFHMDLFVVKPHDGWKSRVSVSTDTPLTVSDMEKGSQGFPDVISMERLQGEDEGFLVGGSFILGLDIFEQSIDAD